MVERKRAYYTEMRKREKELLLQFIRKHKRKPIKQILGLYSQETGFKISKLEIYVKEMQQAGLIK